MKREVVRTNVYKLRRIVDWIRGQGRLPADQFGQILPVDDLMRWYGLSDCLTLDEQLYIERELKGMVEAELAVEQIKQLQQVYSVMR